MVKLEVFGQPRLIDTNNQNVSPVTASLPLLIATYVVLKHKDEAERETVRKIFFPMGPDCPEDFDEACKIIYEKVWEYGRTTSIKGKKYSINEKDLPSSLAQDEIQSACKQLQAYEVLQAYDVIKNPKPQDKPLTYQLSSKLEHYLSGFRNDDGKDKKLRIQKTFSAHVEAIRKFVKKSLPDEVNEMVPSGKSNENLIIRLPINLIEFKKALADKDFDQIKAVYCGPFLSGLENNPRQEVWTSPTLRFWIQTKRQSFAAQVSQTLLQIIQSSEQTDNERPTLAKEIQDFCKQCKLNDQRLKDSIEKVLAKQPSPYEDKPPSPSEESVSGASEKPFIIQVVDKKDRVPTHIRNHLLTKMDEDCRRQLETKNHWIDTNVSIQKKFGSQESFLVRDSRLLKVLLGQSDDFMVLLGEAGMGKSLVLRHFAHELIVQARDNEEKPIPLIFHLADWAISSFSFEDWLRDQLISLGLGENNIDAKFNQLVDNKQCVFLLDGFDNLPPQQWLACLESINGFIQTQGEANLGGVIIASRPDEYKFVKQWLLDERPNTVFRFATEATIQALTLKQSRIYITSHIPNIPRLTLNTLLSTDVLRTPFGLTLFVENAQSHYGQVYENQVYENTETEHEAVKTSLISTYVQARFDHAEDQRKKLPYTKQEVTTWLGHIAKSISMGGAFYVEALSPKILSEKQLHRYQWWFTVFFGIVFGFMMGGIAGLIFGNRPAKHIDLPIILPDAFVGIHQVLTQWIEHDLFIDKIALVLSYASIGVLCGLLMSSLTFLLFRSISIITSKKFFPAKIFEVCQRSKVLRRIFPDNSLSFPIFLGGYLALSLGITGWLVDGGQWSFYVIILFGSLGLLLGLLFEPKHTNPLEIDLRKYTRFDYDLLFNLDLILNRLRSTLLGLLFIPISMLLMSVFSLLVPKLSLAVALLQGFTIGLSFTLGYIFYRLKTKLDWEKNVFLPSQKLKSALKRSALMILMIGGFITLLVTGLSAYHLGWPGNLSFGLRVGMPLGIVFGFLFYGGIDVLKHITLRWFMYQEGMTPRNYTQFLEYAKGLMFLKPQSGGYAFWHDWFQEYFMNRKK